MASAPNSYSPDNDLTLEGDRPSAGSKLLNKFMFAGLAVALLAVVVLIYWATASNKPLEIKNSPFPVRTIREHPTAGGVIIMLVDFCKHVDADGELRISFLSEAREVFQPVVAEESRKGCTKTEYPILIPPNLPPDEYIVKFRATYDLNPLKRGVSQDFESQPVIIDPTTPTNNR